MAEPCRAMAHTHAVTRTQPLAGGGTFSRRYAGRFDTTSFLSRMMPRRMRAFTVLTGA
jgi:hypothetical protein